MPQAMVDEMQRARARTEVDREIARLQAARDRLDAPSAAGNPPNGQPSSSMVQGPGGNGQQGVVGAPASSPPPPSSPSSSLTEETMRRIVAEELARRERESTQGSSGQGGQPIGGHSEHPSAAAASQIKVPLQRLDLNARQQVVHYVALGRGFSEGRAVQITQAIEQARELDWRNSDATCVRKAAAHFKLNEQETKVVSDYFDYYTHRRGDLESRVRPELRDELRKSHLYVQSLPRVDRGDRGEYRDAVAERNGITDVDRTVVRAADRRHKAPELSDQQAALYGAKHYRRAEDKPLYESVDRENKSVLSDSPLQAIRGGTLKRVNTLQGGTFENRAAAEAAIKDEQDANPGAGFNRLRNLRRWENANTLQAREKVEAGMTPEALKLLKADRQKVGLN